MDFYDIGKWAAAGLALWAVIDRLDKISKQLGILIRIQERDQ